jgi:K+-transporting ATPase ATPase C chain
MLDHLRPAVALTIVFTLLTGVAYPLAMTGVAQTMFPRTADGSFVLRDGVTLGSELIGQPFVEARYLHPRPSATGWNAAASGGSNLGPTSAALIAEVAARRAAWEAENGAPAPIDAVTASGSGLDPDVSVANALGQADRIASARGIDPAAVRDLIAAELQGRLFGLYGEPRVNVLRVNLALDAAFPVGPAPSVATE